ncbi:little elongation complex subunit 2 isoform X1 [Pseudoliparis swirei]|uniref:little elongation complex subunit 2 isoform X1 n=1 Tax=Pseudoliparis swirei TaxID=2059687 RepID=UPI0024BDE106|nr:little elongation complex subunit 2 isoform X1 [Pseudoliparis swirei]
MELVWEDLPVPEAPFFTKDVYDKYSLAPNIRELWTFLQSPVDDNKQGVGSANTACSPSTKETAELKDNSCIRKESCWDSSDIDDAAGGAEESMDTEKSRVKLKQVEEELAAYPEPRLPLPCMSNLSSKEQKTYLGFLMNKTIRDTPQNLQARVNNEVMQFMSYLQDVAKICADDYNFISQGAMQYSEEFLRGCLDHIKTFPELYQIYEMTSLTGGTFNPGLQLTFEKQLLIMGNVDITDHKIVPADAQLASDYHSVSSENPPAKKARDMHAKISTDSNAQSLSAHYEPEVCLTRDALLRLLDNHGPDFGEQWELPVWVKLNPEKGSSQKKTVYIESPLLQTEMKVRERSHIYHEESLKLSFKKDGSKNVFHLLTELPEDDQQLPPRHSERNVVSSGNNGLDFEMDLSDLETFGEAAPIKPPKMQKEKNARVKSLKAPGSPSLDKTKKSSEHLVNTGSGSQEEMNSSSADVTGPMKEETTQPVANHTMTPKPDQMSSDSGQQSDENCPFLGDSDEEKLVIDDSVSPTNTRTASRSADPPIIPVSESETVNLDSLSPQKGKKQRRLSKRAKVSGDQLGDILRMQTAMFNSPGEAKGSTKSQEINSPTRCVGPSVHSHPTSLVKPCVSSYLERNQNQDGETCAAPHVSAPVVNITTTGHKKILSQVLQAGAEDEQDYTAPEEGNLLYKLYSLQELLLMVRSSVSLTHTRKVGQKGQNQFVPVHVLPKLEYQLNYGVECLSSSEACQLWTETLLHSSTVSYIAHINAHTSKVALLRKLNVDWKQNISCGFKPSKSLNILHHLLKKLTGLEEGRYLIAHKAGEPFVTLLKEANGKGSRGAYNLQQLHSAVPQRPASGLVPWIPVDPAVVLPFHQKHSRVPCTFPPKLSIKTENNGSSQSNSHGAEQSKNKSNAGVNKKKKQKKRASRRNKYIKKLVQKSF